MSDRSVEAANKKIVLDMWHKVINERDLAQAPNYIVEDYIQNSPSAGQGRAAMLEFFKIELGGAEPRPKSEVKYTKFEHVIAEGDLVQLMFKRKMKSPNDPSRIIEVWWYDTYRLKNGMIVEHWDSALE
ncbi:MAG: nuclear transport factor 2 family protein [Alphaproteobacteria bacterium]